MIRPTNGFSGKDAGDPVILTSADFAPEDGNPVWNLDELPPELEYFRTSDAYQVELADFQGPMDLLLYLIQKDEIDVYDIPIAHITEQFLRHVEIIRIISLDRAGEFIAMAATLLVIKMKMLMPQHGGEDEMEDLEDPRAELVRRLLEYKRFKSAAAALKSCEDERHRYFMRQTRYPFAESLELEPELRIEMFDLLAALGRIFDRLQSRPVHQIQREPFTVMEKITIIRGAVESRASVRFEELFNEDAIRMEVVVTFVAILELVKRGEITFLQTEARGPIWVQAAGVPMRAGDEGHGGETATTVRTGEARG